MNKEDLIKKYEGLEGVWNANGAEIARQCFLRDLEQLNEIDTKKVTVPQFVADFIAEQKKLGHTLSYSIDACMSDIVAEWYWDNSEFFALAWIDGYTVEEYKRYTVVMEATKQPLYYNAWDKKLFFSMGGLATKFTRKELEEAGFGEALNSPLFEVEEVTE